jgi:adenosine tuberculosinyltransferase
MKQISLHDFLALTPAEVAAHIRASGPRVCIFPINGTRRWFMLEHGDDAGNDPLQTFMDVASRNHVELYRLFFDHGIHTLITPVIGAEILTRGEPYMARIGAEGYARLASGEDFLNFYKEYGVRVRFYGDYRSALSGTPYRHLIEQFDEVAAKTEKHQTYRLFLGAFADNSTECIARMAVEYYQEHAKVPDHHTLVELYYGEYVEAASLFIGFDKLSVFDYPLLASGEEDLYFTIAPSPYMNARQLRFILYDHLYTRRSPEADYTGFSAAARNRLRTFYENHKDLVIGVGTLLDDIWVPQLDNTAEMDHHD